MSNFSFSHRVFKRLVQQKRGLFSEGFIGEDLAVYKAYISIELIGTEWRLWLHV